MEGTGLNDGEGVERLWSYLRKFSSITKEMIVSNRHYLLVDALEHYSNRIKEKLGKFVFTLYYFEHFHILGWIIIYW